VWRLKKKEKGGGRGGAIGEVFQRSPVRVLTTPCRAAVSVTIFRCQSSPNKSGKEFAEAPLLHACRREGGSVVGAEYPSPPARSSVLSCTLIAVPVVVRACTASGKIMGSLLGFWSTRGSSTPRTRNATHPLPHASVTQGTACRAGRHICAQVAPTRGAYWGS
jgi:hypothetical protein